MRFLFEIKLIDDILMMGRYEAIRPIEVFMTDVFA